MSQPLQTSAIRAQLRGGQLDASAVKVLDEVDSTNAWCRRALQHGRTPPFACLADSQLAGRGRRGREWVSPPGSNIYLSFVRGFDAPLTRPGCLALAMGLAVTRALHELGIAARLKWPNDVLIDGGKVAGILVETGPAQAAGIAVIIGIGINLDMDAEHAPPDCDWTSIARHAPATGVPDRNRVAALVLDHCAALCEQFERDPGSVHGSLVNVFADAEAVEVRLEDGRRISGQMRGIGAECELRVSSGGELHQFNSADVSLRAGSGTA